MVTSVVPEGSSGVVTGFEEQKQQAHLEAVGVAGAQVM